MAARPRRSVRTTRAGMPAARNSATAAAGERSPCTQIAAPLGPPSGRLGASGSSARLCGEAARARPASASAPDALARQLAAQGPGRDDHGHDRDERRDEQAERERLRHPACIGSRSGRLQSNIRSPSISSP